MPTTIPQRAARSSANSRGTIPTGGGDNVFAGPIGPLTSVASHEPSGMTTLLDTGPLYVTPPRFTTNVTFGAVTIGTSSPDTFPTSPTTGLPHWSGALDVVGGGKSGWRTFYPIGWNINGDNAVSWTIVLNPPAGYGRQYIRTRVRYHPQWTNGAVVGSGGNVGTKLYEPVTYQHGSGAGATENHVIGGLSGEKSLPWNMSQFVGFLLQGPNGHFQNVMPPFLPSTDPSFFGDLAGGPVFGSLPATTMLGVNAASRDFDMGFFLNHLYAAMAPENLDYQMNWAQCAGGIMTEEVAFQEGNFIAGVTSPTSVTFNYVPADTAVAQAQVTGVKVKAYIFAGTNGISMTPRGNWVSGTSYAANDGAYDTVSGTNRWYVCTTAVSGTTAPHLDATHWTPQTYSPDFYNTVISGASFATDAQNLMNTIIDGYTKHYNTPGTATAWNSSSTYVAGNTVSVGGVNYTAFVSSTNVPPPNTNFWIRTTGLNEYCVADKPLQATGASGTGFMPSPWYAFLGSSWVSLAMQRVHTNDTLAMLQVNVNNVELAANTVQQGYVTTLAQNLLNTGGIGTRMLVIGHACNLNNSNFAGGTPAFTQTAFQTYLNGLLALRKQVSGVLASVGCQLWLAMTECDMGDDTFDDGNPADGVTNQTNRDNAVGANYTTFLNSISMYQAYGVLKEVIFKQFSDNTSWRNWPPNGTPLALTNRGNWVSGTAYILGDGTFDTTASNWYVCTANVTGSTNPGADGAHWAIRTAGPPAPQRTDHLLMRPCLVNASYQTKPAYTAVNTWLNSLAFARRWHVLENLQIPESTPGAGNGAGAEWVDGVMMFFTTSLLWLAVGNLVGYPQLQFNSTFGGGTVNPPLPNPHGYALPPSVDLYWDIDYIYISQSL